MRATTVLLTLMPLLLAGCGRGECTDIGSPSGVRLLIEDDEAAPQGATAVVCAAGSCGTVAVAAGSAFVELPLEPGEEVEVVVSIRDGSSREVARSELTMRPVSVSDQGACDTGDAAQSTLVLDRGGRATRGDASS